jgi:hypothetical protein
MGQKAKDGADKLAALMSGGGGGEATKEDMVLEEAAIKEIDALLEFVAKRTKGQIFDMQELLEAACDELRQQIRESAEEEGK